MNEPIACGKEIGDRECGETHPATVPHKGVVAFVILNGVKDLARHNESQGFVWCSRGVSQTQGDNEFFGRNGKCEQVNPHSRYAGN